MTSARRGIPAVHRFTTDPAVATYDGVLGRGNVRACVQRVLDETRSSAGNGSGVWDFESLRLEIVNRLAASLSEGLIGVINATGILLHTNFGRAPLPEVALEAARDLGSGYTNLEFDVRAGKRGTRYDRVAAQLRELSGAQGALVVNNCAAAVLLVLDTFARAREVVVSRGQLIEIGGGFRLPDVLQKSGAKLVEVGTTNKTYPHDYRNAWSHATAMFMRTHPSNYRIEGFTDEVDSKTLAALARELGVIAFEDLGSGALVDVVNFGLSREPTVAQEISAGMDLVAVSGDKLLGGPQCGIIVGREDLVAALKGNPLLRALRVDKLTLAALGATLRLYLEDKLEQIPLYGLLRASAETLHARAASICSQVQQRESTLSCKPVGTLAATGGGTLPQSKIPSAGISVCTNRLSADDLAAALRKNNPPIVGRLDDSVLVLDLKTVFPGQDRELLAALQRL